MWRLLNLLDSLFWGYIAFVLIIVLGVILTFQAKFFQIRNLHQVIKTFFYFLQHKQEKKAGVHPLKTFFASVGGMIGIGNIVSVVTAIRIGGPGALFWLWVTGIIGAVVKYCEIYLGCKYRVSNEYGGYDGGPMYFLRRAFSSTLIPSTVAALLCIYGVEIYQFSVIAESVSSNWHIPHILVTVILLFSVLYAAKGGVRRLGEICSYVMPFFLVAYVLMSLWILSKEMHILPSLLAIVFKSAFTGHAAIGGFAGSSMILVVQNGIARAAYSADIGIGYDSIIQSESSSPHPERQARLAILGVFIDNVICSLSMLIVLLSGVWKILDPLEGSQMIQLALSKYFSCIKYFLPLFLIITGYTTIVAYFAVGIKCASYLFPKRGKTGYLIYGTLCFLFFSFVPQSQALLIMSLSGAMLLSINLLGIFRLRNEINFDYDQKNLLDIDFT